MVKIKLGGCIIMKKIMVFMAAFCIIFAAGCSLQKDETDVNAVTLDKNGGITGTFVEDFTESNYDVKEFENFVNEGIRKYNQTAGEEKIKLNRIENKQNQMIVSMYYKSYIDYAEFNSVNFYQGTVGDAMGVFDFAASFVKVEKGEKTGADAQIERAAKVLILEEPIYVNVNGKIEAVSGNVNVIGKKEAIVSNAEEELAYIIYQ